MDGVKLALDIYIYMIMKTVTPTPISFLLI